MHILTIGLNYRTAPVEVREQFAIASDRLAEALHQLRRTTSVMECVIVATCNRTELYAVVDRLHVCGHHLRSFMDSWFGVSTRDYVRHFYIYEDEDAVRHLFRVACGLDSMILGETQILGQVRDAFLLAQRENVTGTMFNMLFKQAITLAKRAHSETAISENAVSVSYAAVELGKRIFGHFGDKQVMIVGAGKMSELTAKHLHANGAGKVVVVNRTLERAQALASQFSGEACTLEDMFDYLADTDIVISSTGSSGYVLSRAQVAELMERRPGRPLFLIDIAVPRDLDPAIEGLPDVHLYDIDDLEGIVESNLEQRRAEAEKINRMIEQELREFGLWLKRLGVSPLIRALQDKAAAIHEETLASLFNKLPDLSERERKVIRKLTKSIVNQMLHAPILSIKEMADGPDSDRALELFARIFQLEVEPDKPIGHAARVEPFAPAAGMRHNLGQELPRKVAARV